MRVRITAFLVLVALMGSSLGYLARPAEATSVFFSVRVNPGATDYLLCTWHGACYSSGPTAGYGLDWRGTGGSAVFFRGWNLRDDTSSPTSMATVELDQYNGNCKRVRAKVLDDGDTFLASIYYVHTDKNSVTSFTLSGDDGYNYQTKWIASVASSELDGTCVNRAAPNEDKPLWDGAHLHQDRSSSVFSYASSNFLTVGTEDIFGVNDWQYYDSWFN